MALEEVLGDSPDAGAAVEAAVVPWGVVDAEQSFEEFGRAVDVGAGDFGEAAEHPVYRRGNVGPVLGGLLVRDPVVRFGRFHFHSHEVLSLRKTKLKTSTVKIEHTSICFVYFLEPHQGTDVYYHRL